MPKPLATAYLDAKIFSFLHYSEGHVESLAHHLKTREWWEKERGFFRLYSSRWTVDELAEGQYRAQEQAVATAKRLPFLPKTTAVDRCAMLYLERGVVPVAKFSDAVQLALATVHEVDYLLTWNYAHLANPQTQHRLETLHRELGWRSPWLVSPDTIQWETLGGDVRRRET